MIGYNPIMSKNLYEYFPVEAVGSFSNPNYFSDYYQNFVNFGLNYYIFPNEEFLIKKNIEQKKYIISFLKNKNWEILAEIDNGVIWKNPNSKPFAYFKNNQNKILEIKFSPGELLLTTDMKTKDTLIINQSYFPGWKMESNSKTKDAKLYNNLTQAYEIQQATENIRIYYQPKSFNYGIFLSIFGIILLFINYKISKK